LRRFARRRSRRTSTWSSGRSNHPLGRRRPAAVAPCPVVGFDQIYSFDVASLANALGDGDRAGERASELAEGLFAKIMNLAGNAGESDEHRALNYLAVRCEAIYRWAVDGRLDAAAIAIQARPSAFGGEGLVDVVFQSTDSGRPESISVLVDVGAEFPFVVSDVRGAAEPAAREGVEQAQ
jgi:hypothetical protein